MSNQVLKTITEVTQTSSLINIFTYYVEAKEFIKAFIKDIVDTVNGVSFIENEEGFIVSEYDDVSFYINNYGELIIVSEDDKDFYTDSNGDLIFEIEE